MVGNEKRVKTYSTKRRNSNTWDFQIWGLVRYSFTCTSYILLFILFPYITITFEFSSCDFDVVSHHKFHKHHTTGLILPQAFSKVVFTHHRPYSKMVSRSP
jgi:hypothetical protein